MHILMLLAGFDGAMFLLRSLASWVVGRVLGRSLVLQLFNMALLYGSIAACSARTRRLGSRAAHQVRRRALGRDLRAWAAGWGGGGALLLSPVLKPCSLSTHQPASAC